MNEKMRRKDRETTEERAYEILKNGEYGILSTIGEDGYPYGVPVNFAVEGNKIYFHCAPNAGLKLKNVEYSNKVSFCTVQNNRMLPSWTFIWIISSLSWRTNLLILMKRRKSIQKGKMPIDR